MLNPQIVSTTSKTITVTWTPQPECGYRFSVDRIVVSHTWNENQKQTTFSLPNNWSKTFLAEWQKTYPGEDPLTSSHIYEIEPIAIGEGEKVSYP